MRYPQATLIAFATAVGLPLVAAGDDRGGPALKKGDKIVFLGDSITEAGVFPKGYVTLLRNNLAEKHKDLGVEVIGAGISGNKVPNPQTRLATDELAKKPTLVVICIGINVLIDQSTIDHRLIVVPDLVVRDHPSIR